MLLLELLKQEFENQLDDIDDTKDMITLEVPAINLITIAHKLQSDARFSFEQLIDLCGVDYSTYGVSEWRTEETTETGFSRATNPNLHERATPWNKPRFAVVYHLLSVQHNQRLRLRVFVESSSLLIPSVVKIWPAANWFEREAFDLFGIAFDGHPDLRRILTDYGFKGHPFRKDFPLIGHVELRYDATEKRCVYEPVSIQARVTVPKVIRHDNRYLPDGTQELDHDRH